jgi:hypothetical protein
MKNHPTSPAPSDENTPDPAPSVDPAAEVASAPKAPTMTIEEWTASQPYRPLPRVPLIVVAHLYRGGTARPPSRLIERPRKAARIDWVQAFYDAEVAREAAAVADAADAAATDETEDS